MPTALALSPHLDDVAFSCGGALALLRARGWRCLAVTAFTRSVPEPTGFALVCQTDKGIPPERDYMALRRAEDAAWAERLGCETRWLDLPEAPHRGYDGASALFAGPRADDDVWRPLAEALERVVAAEDPVLILAPQGLGGHVDHRQAIRALGLSLGEDPPPVLWYRDTPYAVRHPSGPAAPEAQVGLEEMALDIGAHLEAKLDGAAAYASQLAFQFGGEEAMREALSAFAHGEGRRLGAGGAAEALGASATDLRALRALTEPAAGTIGSGRKEEGLRSSRAHRSA